MRKSPMFVENIICQSCGKVTPRRGPVQKYCPECSEIKDLDRKRTWAKRNPLPIETTRQRRTKQVEREIERAAENQIATTPIQHSVREEIYDFHSLVRVSVPFDYGYSKNSIYRLNGRGHVALREETKALRAELIAHIRNAMGGENPFVNAKIYLDIFVEKPDHKGDAVNVIDTVCDAVKDAIGVDDRWYSIRSLDWQIVKTGGRLFVGIGQEETEEQRACHRCGRMFPISSFSGKKHKGRVCQECRRENGS